MFKKKRDLFTKGQNAGGSVLIGRLGFCTPLLTAPFHDASGFTHMHTQLCIDIKW